MIIGDYLMSSKSDKERIQRLETLLENVLLEIKEVKDTLENCNTNIDKLSAHVNEELSKFKLEISSLKTTSKVLIYLGGLLTSGLFYLFLDLIRRALFP